MTEDEIIAAADAILRERVKPLADLWTKTNSDWYLQMSWSMTEPVCPFVCIQDENNPKDPKFGYWADGPIEAMLKSIDAACGGMEEN